MAAFTTSDRAAALATFRQFTARFGADAGLCWFSLGLPIEKAAALHGTPLGNRILRHDPAAELNGQKAAGLFHVDPGTFRQIGPPPADRVNGAFSFWKLTTLAIWAANECPGPSGRKRPEWLGRFGGVEKEKPRELTVAERFAAGIRLPGRRK